jgi:hypothetical protein
MLYEIIADCDRVIETLENSYREGTETRFEILDDAATEPADDPICNSRYIGRRLCDGFSLLGIE